MAAVFGADRLEANVLQYSLGNLANAFFVFDYQNGTGPASLGPLT